MGAAVRTRREIHVEESPQALRGHDRRRYGEASELRSRNETRALPGKSNNSQFAAGTHSGDAAVCSQRAIGGCSASRLVRLFDLSCFSERRPELQLFPASAAAALWAARRWQIRGLKIFPPG